MVKLIKLTSDGNVQCYDAEGCLVHHYSGFWSNVVHTLLKNMKATPSDVEPEMRVIRPKIVFSTPDGKHSVPITESHFKKIVAQIKTSFTFE